VLQSVRHASMIRLAVASDGNRRSLVPRFDAGQLVGELIEVGTLEHVLAVIGLAAP
jgi:hypothetical protein